MAPLNFRLMDDGPGEAAWNMAVDEVLLGSALQRPTLRFYAWRPAAISIGCLQKLEKQAGVTVVRRLTGGGAILHQDELTFAVAAPLAVLGGARAGVRASFDAVNAAVAAGLGTLGLEVGWGDAAPDDASPSAFMCYDRASPTDLIVRARKLVGSAQRRAGQAVLQHGSVPLGLQSEKDSRFTLAAAVGRAVAYDEVARAIALGFRAKLGIDLEPGHLCPDEVAAARTLAREKYGADRWTARR